MPAAAILGPRQCGKSTLAKHVLSGMDNTLYLDLESSRDLRKLDDPETFFEETSEKLICLDEIQRRPDLFTPLRSILDRGNRNGQVLNYSTLASSLGVSGHTVKNYIDLLARSYMVRLLHPSCALKH